MPYIKIWIHCVWNTKNRLPLLRKEIRQRIFEHIKEYSKTKDIFIDCINGSVEHVHCLISLGGEQSISNIMNLLKGESSLRKYIYNQENHHKKISFTEEFDLFIKKYSFSHLG